MIIQIAKARPYNHFSAYEVATDGTYINRNRTLVVKLPDYCASAAGLGTVWRVLGPVKSREYQRDGFKIREDLIKPKKPKILRPNGELLATWISDNVAGVGITKARRLVRAYSSEELNHIAETEDIEALSSVNGISPNTARLIVDEWTTEAIWAALEFLQESRLPMGVAKRLARVYGDEVESKLRTDPFVLTAFGVSFEDVLGIVGKLSVAVSDESLLAAIAERVALAYGNETGSTVVPEKILIEQAKTVCQEVSVPLERIVESALEKGTFVPAESGYQLVGSAIQEASVAKFLAQCAGREAGVGSSFAKWECSLTDEVIEHALCNFEQSLPFAMTADQRAAISGVVRSNVAVISGGAGTGKSTILLAALAVYEAVSSSMPIFLVALSGRAAQRMAEATGGDAMTIARLIANHLDDKKPDLPNHLLLVVDEASMVDLLSAYRLIGILPYATRIILVGDVAQLPPVGAGHVFHCAMQSDLPAFELKQLKRQGEDSGIHRIATGIRNSEYSDSMLSSPKNDVIYTSGVRESAIISAYLNGGGPEQAVILTPTLKGPLGVKAVNKLIQSHFDKDRPQVVHYVDSDYGWVRWLTSSDSELRLGDQVMVTVNDYEEDIRSGDVGTITEVYDEPRDGCYGVVNFDGRDLELNQAVLEKLELGYAITIHNSQGAQWPTCLLLLPHYAKHMLDQTLLYTAVTRPSEKLVIIGDKLLIQSAIERGSRVYERTTNLLSRLENQVLG